MGVEGGWAKSERSLTGRLGRDPYIWAAYPLNSAASLWPVNLRRRTGMGSISSSGKQGRKGGEKRCRPPILWCSVLEVPAHHRGFAVIEV